MPSILRGEIAANFANFDSQWPIDMAASRNLLEPAKKQFEQSYIRISSIQAWRISVIQGKVSEGSEAFFFEAQNDLLTSHCLARCGSFRQALKALRSAIENVYFALYYKDHPVELENWEQGRHKLGFTELHSYLESHPAINSHELALTNLNNIKAEYATLSKAVHGSAKVFRMTQNLIDIRLWGDDIPSVGKWSSREKATVFSINILLIHLFKDSLLGASNRYLRETVGLVVPKPQRTTIKSKLKITLIAP